MVQKHVDPDPDSDPDLQHCLELSKELPSYRRSLQPSKENIQHFKIRKFFTLLYFSE
jgi:hypothetical protein